MSVTFEDTEVKPDPDFSIPEVENVEFPCTECGREAGPYAGRGRKPTKCPDHKASKSVSTKTRGATGKANADAVQASEILFQYNNIVALLLNLGNMQYTGEAIKDANPTFKEQAYAAFLSDPTLARQVINFGGVSGKASLVMAYGMLGASVAPVAMLEIKTNKANKLAAREAATE